MKQILTSITLSNEFIYTIFSEALDDTVSYFRWSVDVTDGLHVLRRDYHNALPITVNYSLVELSTEESIMPKEFALHQNYPNPFNPSTQIAFDLPESADVRLTVFDVLGRQVANLINQPMKAGSHTVNFDAQRLASGVYIYRLEAGSFSMTRNMMLIK